MSHDFPGRKVGGGGVEEAQGKIRSGLKTGFPGQSVKRGSKDGVPVQTEGSSLPGTASPVDPAKVVPQGAGGPLQSAKDGGTGDFVSLNLPSWEREGGIGLLLSRGREHSQQGQGHRAAGVWTPVCGRPP